MGFLVPAEADASYTDQAELDPYDLLIIAAGHIGTGVRTGCAVTQQGTTDDTVAVSAGTYDIAWAPLTQAGGNVNVLTGVANADGTTSQAADANYFRYDFIVQNTSGQLGVLHGTVPNPVWPSYSVNPKFPTVDFTAHCVLGAVLVPPTAASISGVATSQIVTKDLTHKYPSFANITGTLTAAQGLGLPQGLTGAVSATRYVGGTASVAPTTGTFAVGDYVVTQNGKLFICTTAGTPGTWTQVSGSALTTLLGTDTLWAAKGDLVVATANDTAAVLTAPTQRKQILGADAAGNVAWQPMHAGPAGVRVSDDFFYGTNLTVAANPTWMVGPGEASLSGTTATFGVLGGTANHPGIYQMGTGTTTTGRVAIQTALVFFLGGGRARYGAWVRVPSVSAVAQRFEVTVGFADGYSAATVVDGCYFSYIDTVNSGAWSVTTVSNSVKTATDNVTTGITMTAATWYLLEVEVNAAGTSVDYYVDKVLKVTHTTNIPTGAGRETRAVTSILKSLGTTTSTLDIDAYYLEFDFTTAR